MNSHFTADQHFDHPNIITYANRPFKTPLGRNDVEWMNEELIKRHNAVVAPDDHVYMVGDISMGTPERAYQHIRQLNGVKFWVPGNHDKAIRKDKRICSQFEWVRDLAEIRVEDPSVTAGRDRGTQRIVLCHYAMRVWNQSHRGAWQLFGHSHGNLADDPHSLQLDVGVDNWDFTPVSFERLKEEMAKKSWKPVDHHGADRDL